MRAAAEITKQFSERMSQFGTRGASVHTIRCQGRPICRVLFRCRPYVAEGGLAGLECPLAVSGQSLRSLNAVSGASHESWLRNWDRRLPAPPCHGSWQVCVLGHRSRYSRSHVLVAGFDRGCVKILRQNRAVGSASQIADTVVEYSANWVSHRHESRFFSIKSQRSSFHTASTLLRHTDWPRPEAALRQELSFIGTA